MYSRHRILILVTLLLIAVFVTACNETPNAPPVIERFTVSNTQVYAGETVQLHVSAFDPDGDTVHISWLVSDGTLKTSEDNENRAIWILPDTGGTYFARVKATDGEGISVVDTVDVEVIDSIQIPARSSILLRLLSPIDGHNVRVGDRFPIQVAESVVIDDFTVVEAGAPGVAQVVRVRRPDDQSDEEGGVSLVISKVQLVNGLVVALDATSSYDEKWQADIEAVPGSVSEVGINGRLADVKNIEFPLFPDGGMVVPSGTLFAGALRSDVKMRINAGHIVPEVDDVEQLILVQTCLGFEGVNYSDVLLSVYSDGIRVSGFTPGSAAERSALQIGDRITGIRIGDSEYPVANMSDFHLIVQRLSPGDKVTLLVRNVLRKVDVELVAEQCYVVR